MSVNIVIMLNIVLIYYLTNTIATGKNVIEIEHETTTKPGADQKNKYIIIFILLGLIIIVGSIIIIIYCCCNKDKKKNSRVNQDSEKSSLLDYEKETKTLSGLMNTKETCYMNSMIQAMASSNVLIKSYNRLLEKWEREENCKKMILLRDLLLSINRPSVNCLRENTEKLMELMKHSKWDNVSQEDTFQLLSAIINAIQRDIKGALKRDNITMPPKMKLLHTFTASSDYNKVQEHLALALPLCGDFRNQPGVKLNTLMNAFFESSPIDDGQYETQISLFQEAPDILILHIQANEWDDRQRTYIKPKYYILYEDNMEYEFNIHMKKDGSEIKKTKAVYKLTAVVHHMGSILGGHYVTYRTHEGSWYLTNDRQVEEVSFNYDKVPYVMVYKKSQEI